MQAKDIWHYGLSHGIFSDKISGETPWQTLKSKLSVHIRKYGDASIFVRTSAGHFYLRELLMEPWKVYSADPWVPAPSHERVVVFPSTTLEKVERFQGLIEPLEVVRKEVLCSDSLRTMDRRKAELDDRHKQVLVYILVRRPGEILAYSRGTFSLTDRMLVGRDCVGFGGHVNDGDADLFSTESVGVRGAVARELLEELSVPAADRERLAAGQGFSIVGYLNDDSSPVGRRHFAVVVEYWVANSGEWERPVRGEESITKLRWLPTDSAVPNALRFEYWSQLVLRRFFPEMLKNERSYRIARRRPLTPPHRLVVAGQVGSGKTEACKLLQSEFGYCEVRTGFVMAELLGIPPIPETPREIFQRTAGAFVEQPDGCERLALAVKRAADIVESDRVLIDGVRHIATLDRLRALDERRRLGLLYVATPPDVAFEFYRTREAPGASVHDFLRVRDAPGEEEVEDLLGRADAVIDNWFGRKQYLDALRRLMEELGVEPRSHSSRAENARGIT
jgi:predicted NUDIX family phosphoesterase